MGIEVFVSLFPIIQLLQIRSNILCIKLLCYLVLFYYIIGYDNLFHCFLPWCNHFNCKIFRYLPFFLHGQCYVIVKLSSQIIYLAEKENLCLYGLPNEQWEVNLPAEEVPPELPEPALGINFARDGMQEKDWLSLVAVHSDAWLLSVAFYFGARFAFDKSDR